MTRPRSLPAAAALLAAAAIATAILDPFGGGSGDGLARATAATGATTATVARGRLSSQVYANGTLGYAAQPDGAPYAIVNRREGVYTALPQVPHVTRCGEPLYRVDDRPVLLLCGRVPAWRSLHEGIEGPDVRQLNCSLAALGSATDPTSDRFSAATSYALGELQADRGLERSGALELGDAVFLPGPLRIATVTATLGTSARRGAPIAEATSTRRRVDVDLRTTQASSVEVGDAATITLPDNRTTRGVVRRIGTVAKQPGGADASGATIPVAIGLDRPRAVGRLDGAPVGVRITTGRVRDALSVPVTALVARAGGGYAVETVAAGRRELVPVRLGMFDPAGGRVQVESPRLSAGQRVVVPST